MNQRKGKKGNGVAYLAVARHRSHAGAWGKERPAGAPLAEIRPQGHRGQAARRRRAHPLGSAHAGEGAGDGAGTSLLHRGRSVTK